MNPFTLEPMPTTTSGSGRIAGLADLVRSHGQRAFVVTDPGVRAAGVLDTATDALTAAGIDWPDRRRTMAAAVPTATAAIIDASARLTFGWIRHSC